MYTISIRAETWQILRPGKSNLEVDVEVDVEEEEEAISTKPGYTSGVLR